jgi:radical SAM protein with 4Fe4S-binding SPASM domain
MDWAIFQAVIQCLARRDYEGWLAFHNYNEPLANPRITEEVAYARNCLARARLTVFTNGDYLTAEMYEGLAAAGLTQMRITVYPRSGEDPTPSHERLWRWVDKRTFLRGAEWSETVVRQGPALILEQPVEIELISPDVSRYYDRGGTLPTLSLAARVSPCHLTSHSLSIDYRGDVKMCCNIVTGHSGHEPYFFGNVRERDPIETWDSPRFAEIRRLHGRAQWSATPVCATCRQEIAT